MYNGSRHIRDCNRTKLWNRNGNLAGYGSREMDTDKPFALRTSFDGGRERQEKSRIHQTKNVLDAMTGTFSAKTSLYKKKIYSFTVTFARGFLDAQ